MEILLKIKSKLKSSHGFLGITQNKLSMEKDKNITLCPVLATYHV